MPNQTLTSIPRSSTRLAVKRKIKEEIGLRLSSETYHRPVAGGQAFRNDCGILPSEWYKITASVTDTVPWGYVCGYPTERGDLYGGAHYSPSCSASLTPQGRAIQEAGTIFGDGATLPFTPCKKGYMPVANGRNMYACPLHNESRHKRVAKEGGIFRKGEVDVKEFWVRINGSVRDRELPDFSEHAVKKARIRDEPKLERE